MSTNLAYYEEDVIRLCIDEGKSAEDTIKCLNEQHGTQFTVRQFKGKFNGLKNLSGREWRQIAREICIREAQGLGSEVYLYGRRQDPERVTRALRRYGKGKEDVTPTKIDLSARKYGRQRIEIRNPGAQKNTQGAGTSSSAVPRPTERLATPRSLHLESVIDTSSAMLDNCFGMIANGREFDFDMEGIDLDMSTPQLGGLFDIGHCSSSNTASTAHVENIDMESFLQPHGNLVAADATTGEPSSRPQQLALRQRGDSPFFANCSISEDVSSFNGTTNELGESSMPLIVSPGIPSQMFGVYTGNLIEAGNPTLWTSWDQGRGRVRRGEPGWLASQLIGADPKLEHLTSMANLIEKAFTNSRGHDELRFDGYTKDSINQLFDVVTRLVLNRYLSEEQLLNFIEWIVDKDLVNKMYGFLRKGSPETRAFIAEMLRALSDQASHVKSLSEYTAERQNIDRDNFFIMNHPLETSQLMRTADTRALSGSLGGKLLIHVAASRNLAATKILVSANSDNINYADHDIFYTKTRVAMENGICMTPLCAAVHGGSAEIVSYLISKGADINKRAEKDDLAVSTTTALVEAVRLDNADMVKLLLDAGGELFDNMGIGGSSILEYARNNRPAIYKQLQDFAELKLDSDNAMRSLLLVEAAGDGGHSLSEFLFRHETTIRHGALESALWLAVKKGNVSAVRTLLRRGIDPNVLEYRRTRHVEHFDDTDQDSDSDEENSGSDEEDSDSDEEDSNSDEDDYDPDDISTKKGEKNFDSTHPIYLAVRKEKVSPDILYLLIKAGASITREALSRAMCRAFTHLLNHVIAETLRNKCLLLARLRFHVSLTRPAAFELCAHLGSIEKCDMLLDTGIDINAYGIARNALQTAAGQGHLGLVQHLLEQGANVNAPPKSGYRGKRDEQFGIYRHDRPLTALQGAVLGGHYKVVKCLIEAGAKVTAPPVDATDMTVLEAAAAGLAYKSYTLDSGYHKTQTFRKLLAHGALINRTDGGVCTVLHHLVDASQLECLELALKEHAATEERAEFRMGRPWRAKKMATPIQLAASCHDLEVVQLLLKYNADINAPASDTQPGLTALQAVIECERRIEKEKETKDMVVFLLQHHADINAPASEKFGCTALQAATTWKEPSARIVSLLLQHNADVNAPPAKEGGLTALQGAAISGDIHIAKMLLAHGADVNAAAAPSNGRTAIQGAAEHGRLDMVRLLLENGAVPDPDNGFSEAIKFAEENHRYHIASLLKAHEDAYNGLAMGFIARPFGDFGGPSSGILNELPGDDEIGV